VGISKELVQHSAETKGRAKDLGWGGGCKTHEEKLTGKEGGWGSRQNRGTVSKIQECLRESWGNPKRGQPWDSNMGNREKAAGETLGQAASPKKKREHHKKERRNPT